MKISTNPVGNYTRPMMRTTAPLQKQEVQANQPAKVTADEKDFFVKLYPENKTEIIDYHFYGREGKMNGVSIGSLFDKRG
ncbi:MAG: hypothetical protein IPM56_14655 [Ignavibacteriales bacterium]|nr:MAG: hypothetical protein IPM56_14655 [Ignavibacteriales bacterium]